MEHLAKSMPSCMLVPLDGPSDSRPHRDNTIRSRLRGCSLSQLPWLKRPSVNLKPPASVKTADLIHVWGNLFSGQPSRVCYPGVDCWPTFTLKTKSTCRESIGVGAKSSPENKHSLIDLPSIGATDYQIYSQKSKKIREIQLRNTSILAPTSHRPWVPNARDAVVGAGAWSVEIAGQLCWSQYISSGSGMEKLDLKPPSSEFLNIFTGSFASTSSTHPKGYTSAAGSASSRSTLECC